jgi:flagellar biosynthetic protein FliP
VLRKDGAVFLAEINAAAIEFEGVPCLIGMFRDVTERSRAEEALKRAQEPLRKFMFKQTREKDLALLVKISGDQRPAKPQDVSTLTLVPAFVLSELKTAFEIGFVLYVPFLIIDMVVASILLSMGMMMLPPILISLPFKLMIFVLVDGWHLVVGSLVESFRLG